MPKSQIEALFPQTRRAVLARLLFDPEKEWYLSELAESIGLSGPDIRRELSQLAKAAIIREWRDGNRVYFAANPDCPFFPELRGLLLKTTALVDVLKDALRSLSNKVKVAFVYGSIAKHDEVSTSDVDLMVIGNVTGMELSTHLGTAEKTLQRDVNTSLYSVKEFHEKFEKQDHFLTAVLEEEQIFVLGSADDLEALTRNKTD